VNLSFVHQLFKILFDSNEWHRRFDGVGKNQLLKSDLQKWYEANGN